MRDVCDLCGARLYEGEPACRDCGAPRVGVVAKPLPEDDSDVAARYSREGDTLVEDLEAVPQWLASADADPDPQSVLDAVLTPPSLVAPLEAPALAPVVAGAETLEAAGPGASSSAAVSAAFGPAPGLDDVALEFDVDEPRGRSRVGIAIGAVGVVAVGALAFVFLRPDGASPVADPGATGSATESATEVPAVAPPAQPVPALDCEGAEDLVGTWAFTTEVTTALAVARLGIRGFYELDVAVAGCDVTAAVRKLGYTGRSYKERQVRHAKGNLAKVAGVPERFEGSFALRNNAGKGDDVEFRFSVQGDQLAGTYRHRGEAWASGGISGFLLGQKGVAARRILPVLGEEPCWARCSVACGAARRDGDERLVGELSSCTTACEAAPETTLRCPASVPLPPDLTLTLSGPRSRLNQHCKALGVGGKKDICRREPTIIADGKKAVTPSLDEDEVAGGFSAVHILETKPRRKGALLYRLAFETKAGWFVSDGLLPPNVALGDVGLFARDLGEGDRRYVAGFASGGDSARMFFCRTVDRVPKCALVEPDEGQVIMPLPGGALARVTHSETSVYGLD